MEAEAQDDDRPFFFFLHLPAVPLVTTVSPSHRRTVALSIQATTGVGRVAFEAAAARVRDCELELDLLTWLQRGPLLLLLHQITSHATSTDTARILCEAAGTTAPPRVRCGLDPVRFDRSHNFTDDGLTSPAGPGPRPDFPLGIHRPYRGSTKAPGILGTPSQ